MARISTVSAVLGPCVAVALAVALTACSADDPAHRSFRPQDITASGVPYSGNGIAALDPQAIVTKTVKATSSAPTVHLSGTLTGVPVPAQDTSTAGSSSDSSSGGGTNGSDASSSPSSVPTAAGTFKVDMVFTQFGAVGDVSNGTAASRLLRVEDEVWAAQPAEFWAAAGAVDNGKAYGGLYVRVPSADPRYAGFTDDTRIGFLLDRLLQTSATWKKGLAGTVNGMSAIELDGTGRGGHTASIWVATDGEPYILRIAPTAGSYQGRIDFTEYGDRLAVQAPLPGRILDNALLVLPSLSPSTISTSALPPGRPVSTSPSAVVTTATTRSTPSAPPTSAPPPSTSPSATGSAPSTSD
ncbi:MAG: hypothetical protein ACRDSS_08065, partial [Actinocrinis sp.]